MKVLSLFSGVGGFDLGLEAAGMQTVFQCEWDKHCLSVLNRHWADVPKWGDISTLTGKHILAQAPQIDVVAWGSPCQDLSQAGKRVGLKGGRSGLFYEGIRIIKELREETNGKYPRFSIWENVAGALNSNKGADFGAILDAMAEAGAMVIEWKLLDTKYFGIAQARRRVFVVAGFNLDRSELDSVKIFPINESDSRYIQKGNEVSFYQSHGVQDQFNVGFTNPLKKIAACCVVSETLKPRRLTPIESERLQGYPDDWTRWGADGQEQKDVYRYQQCGNGVTAPVAQWVGEQVMKLYYTPE